MFLSGDLKRAVLILKYEKGAGCKDKGQGDHPARSASGRSLLVQ